MFFEGIGVLLKRKLIDIDLVDDLFTGPKKITWEKFEENGYHTIIIGSDDIRDMIPGYSENFDPEREPIIRKITLNLVRVCLELGFNVINDDLNYYKSMRHDLFEIAKALDSHFYSIFIKVSLEKAIEWNEKRGLPIPNSVIEKVYER